MATTRTSTSSSTTPAADELQPAILAEPRPAWTGGADAPADETAKPARRKPAARKTAGKTGRKTASKTASKTAAAKPAARKTATAKPAARKTATAKPAARKTATAKPAASSSGERVTGRDAIAKVMADGKTRKAADITAAAVKLIRPASKGKTPEATLGAFLYTQAKKPDGLVVRTANPGEFKLRTAKGSK